MSTRSPMPRSARRRLLAGDRAARRELAAAKAELARVTGATRSERWSSTVLAVTAVLIVAMVVAVAAAGWSAVSASNTYSDGDYQRVAAERVQLLLTPNYRDAGQSRRILDGSTDAFRDEFAQATDAYSQFVKGVGTVSTGVVDGTAIAGRAGDRVTLLVTAAINVTASAGDGQGTKRFRVRTEVIPDGGELKLATVEFLP